MSYVHLRIGSFSLDAGSSTLESFSLKYWGIKSIVYRDSKSRNRKVICVRSSSFILSTKVKDYFIRWARNSQLFNEKHSLKMTSLIVSQFYYNDLVEIYIWLFLLQIDVYVWLYFEITHLYRPFVDIKLTSGFWSKSDCYVSIRKRFDRNSCCKFSLYVQTKLKNWVRISEKVSKLSP